MRQYSPSSASLSAAVSTDGGTRWTKAGDIDTGEDCDGGNLAGDQAGHEVDQADAADLELVEPGTAHDRVLLPRRDERRDVDAGRLERGESRAEWPPFASAVGIFVLSFAGLAYSLFPYLVVDRLDAWEAASAPEFAPESSFFSPASSWLMNSDILGSNSGSMAAIIFAIISVMSMSAIIMGIILSIISCFSSDETPFIITGIMPSIICFITLII